MNPWLVAGMPLGARAMPVAAGPEPYGLMAAQRVRDLEFLRRDLMGELEAINEYQSHLQQASDPQVRAWLFHIIQDEREHVAELTRLIRRLDPYQEAKFAALHDEGSAR